MAMNQVETAPKEGTRKKAKGFGFLLPVGSLLATILVWEAIVRLFNVPVYILPRPSAIFHTAIAQHQYLFKHAVSTSWAIILGFAWACIVGIPLATIMTFSESLRRVIHPLLIVAQVLPKVALAPLFIVWFGFGMVPKVVMTFLIALFPIVIDTLAGLSTVRPESLMLLRSMGASRSQSFWKVRLPTALPHIFSGLKIAMTFAVVGAIVAEFVASDSGLGYVLVDARANLDMVMVFAAIIWLIVLGFLFYYVVEFAERIFVKGKSHRRTQELGAGL
jgi:NitT/TauT family transport system permease protein